MRYLFTILLAVATVQASDVATFIAAVQPPATKTAPTDWFTEFGWQHRSPGNTFDLSIQHERDEGIKYTDVNASATTIIDKYKLGIRYADVQERDLYSLSATAERIWGTDSLHVGAGYEQTWRERWLGSDASYARTSAVVILGNGTVGWNNRMSYSRNTGSSRLELQSAASVTENTSGVGLSLVGNWLRQKSKGASADTWNAKFVVTWRVRS